MSSEFASSVLLTSGSIDFIPRSFNFTRILCSRTQAGFRIFASKFFSNWLTAQGHSVPSLSKLASGVTLGLPDFAFFITTGCEPEVIKLHQNLVNEIWTWTIFNDQSTCISLKCTKMSSNMNKYSLDLGMLLVKIQSKRTKLGVRMKLLNRPNCPFARYFWK